MRSPLQGPSSAFEVVHLVMPAISKSLDKCSPIWVSQDSPEDIIQRCRLPGFTANTGFKQFWGAWECRGLGCRYQPHLSLSNTAPQIFLGPQLPSLRYFFLPLFIETVRIGHWVGNTHWTTGSNIYQSQYFSRKINKTLSLQRHLVLSHPSVYSLHSKQKSM